MPYAGAPASIPSSAVLPLALSEDSVIWLVLIGAVLSLVILLGLAYLKLERFVHGYSVTGGPPWERPPEWYASWGQR